MPRKEGSICEKSKDRAQRTKFQAQSTNFISMKLLRELLYPLIAVVSAFIVTGILILIIGDNPLEAYRLLFGSAFSWPVGIGYTLFYATPLIFTGLAVMVAFRCGLLNIGAEGQLYVAAFATAWVGIKFGGVFIRAPTGEVINSPIANLPSLLLILFCFLAAVLAGGLWGAIPGILKARFGSHEVINTIMLNFLAVALLSYFTQYHYKMPGDPIMESVAIGDGAHIARLGRFIPSLPQWIPLNLSFLLALICCGLVYLFLWRTKWGYELRATGTNPSAAEYGGISVRKQIVIAMTISGSLAGLVAINEVLGYRYRYYDGFSDNYGFTGIAVALLGRNHPVGVIISALLFAILQRGGIPVDAFTEHVTKDIVQVLQGTIILFVAAEAFFRGPFAKFGLLKRSKV
jgi:general nucleoside transport system permease protein